MDFSQKSVLKWIEMLGLDRIGLGFYLKNSIKVNRNVGYFLIRLDWISILKKCIKVDKNVGCYF